jgi:hypothetical protein
MNMPYAMGRRSHSFSKLKIDQQLAQLDQYLDTLDGDTFGDEKPPMVMSTATAHTRIDPRSSDPDIYLEAEDSTSPGFHSHRYSGALEKMLFSKPLDVTKELSKFASQTSLGTERVSMKGGNHQKSTEASQRLITTKKERSEQGDRGGLFYDPMRRTKSSSALSRRRGERMQRQDSTRGGTISEVDKESGMIEEGIATQNDTSRCFRNRRNGHHSPGRLSPYRRKERVHSRMNSTQLVNLQAFLGVASTPTSLPPVEVFMPKEVNDKADSRVHNAGMGMKSETIPEFRRSQSGQSLRNRREASSPHRVNGSSHRRQEERSPTRLSASLSPTSTGSRRWRQIEAMDYKLQS